MISLELYTFKELTDQGLPNFFSSQSELLTEIGTTPEAAFTYFKALYPSRYTTYSAVTIGTIAELVFRENEYKYRTLAGTLNLEYDPIENYNMREETEFIKNQTFNRTNDTLIKNNQKTTVDSQNTKKNNQQQEMNVTADAEDNFDETNYGRTLTRGGKDTSTTTHKINPYDNAGDLNATEDHTETSPGSTDTEGGTDTTKHGTNQTTTVSYTTPEGVEGDTDNTTITTTYEGEPDTTNITVKEYYTGDEPDKNILTRSGNIGVTTSQMMIQSERDLADFNLLKIIFNDLCDRLFISEIY